MAGYAISAETWRKRTAASPASTPDDASEPESAGEDRPPHMDVEAQIAVARCIVKVEAAITQVEVDPRVERVVERAEPLPVGMPAQIESADIAIGAQAEPVAEIEVISSADQRVAPAGSLIDALTGKQTGVQLQIRSKSPSAEAGTQIRELGRRLEEAVQ